MDRTGGTPGSDIVHRLGFRYPVYGVAGFGRLAVPIAQHMPFFVLLLAGQPVAEMPWSMGMILLLYVLTTGAIPYIRLCPEYNLPVPASGFRLFRLWWSVRRGI